MRRGVFIYEQKDHKGPRSRVQQALTCSQPTTCPSGVSRTKRGLIHRHCFILGIDFHSPQTMLPSGMALLVDVIQAKFSMKLTDLTGTAGKGSESEDLV